MVCQIYYNTEELYQIIQHDFNAKQVEHKFCAAKVQGKIRGLICGHNNQIICNYLYNCVNSCLITQTGFSLLCMPSRVVILCDWLYFVIYTPKLKVCV